MKVKALSEAAEELLCVYKSTTRTRVWIPVTKVILINAQHDLHSASVPRRLLLLKQEINFEVISLRSEDLCRVERSI